jgi:hypothetical protein
MFAAERWVPGAGLPPPIPLAGGCWRAHQHPASLLCATRTGCATPVLPPFCAPFPPAPIPRTPTSLMRPSLLPLPPPLAPPPSLPHTRRPTSLCRTATFGGASRCTRPRTLPRSQLCRPDQAACWPCWARLGARTSCCTCHRKGACVPFCCALHRWRLGRGAGADFLRYAPLEAWKGRGCCFPALCNAGGFLRGRPLARRCGFTAEAAGGAPGTVPARSCCACSRALRLPGIHPSVGGSAMHLGY